MTKFQYSNKNIRSCPKRNMPLTAPSLLHSHRIFSNDKLKSCTEESKDIPTNPGGLTSSRPP
jgi:hypothetical protein